jgi:hypothetical protein
VNSIIKKISLIFKEIDLADGDFAEVILSIDGFIESANRRTDLFSIEYPTMPKKVSPKLRPILFFSLILGGLIGVFYVLISNSIRKRKE